MPDKRIIIKESPGQIKMNELNDQMVRIIKKDFSGHIKSGRELAAYVASATAEYNGKLPIYVMYMPKLFTEKEADFLKHTAETMHGILKRMIEEYIKNPEYRSLFGFSKQAEELILTPSFYDSLLPMARVDIFLNEEDMSFKFCEFNADGSSGMNEDREFVNGFKDTLLYKELSKDYRLKPYELFDTWCETVKRIYGTYKNRVPDPRIGIVDFTEKGCSPEEFIAFKEAFIRNGMDAVICEIRDMRYKDGILYDSEDRRIDIVYRRAVTRDVLENSDEIKDFLAAVKDGNVCLIGSFATQVIHDKIAFVNLHLKETQSFLTGEQNDFVREHVPYTAELKKEKTDIDEIIETKDKWLIKPRDSYGAVDIYAGNKFKIDEWAGIIKKHEGSDFLVQEFCTPYRTVNLDCQLKEPRFINYSNLTGLFLYDGKFSGAYSRISDDTIIAEQYDENDIGSYVIRAHSQRI